MFGLKKINTFNSITATAYQKITLAAITLAILALANWIFLTPRF